MSAIYHSLSNLLDLVVELGGDVSHGLLREHVLGGLWVSDRIKWVLELCQFLLLLPANDTILLLLLIQLARLTVEVDVGGGLDDLELLLNLVACLTLPVFLV